MSAKAVEPAVDIVSVTDVLDGTSGRERPKWIAAGELFNK